MFSIEEAEYLLRKELNDANCSEDADMKTVWSAYKKFAETKFDCAFDILTWETGDCTWTEDPAFYCAVIRNFYDNASILAYVGLYFYFEPNDSVKEIKDCLSQSESESKLMFLSKVEKRGSFQVLQSKFPLKKYDLGFEGL